MTTNSDVSEGGRKAGYGNPPQRSRFRPAQSGDPKGRPKGVKSRKKIVGEIANEMHWSNENGERRKRSILDFVLLTLRKFALDGNIKALRVFHELLEKYEPHGSQYEGPFLIAPEELTMEEWLEKFSPLGNMHSEGETEN